MTENMDYRTVFENVAKAGRDAGLIRGERIYDFLHSLSNEVMEQSSFILDANRKDLERMDKSDPRYDRLMLTSDRLKAIASDIINVARQPSPLGRVSDERIMSNGLNISRISVPLGVVGIIYEARPNVTLDVFSLCLKSGNACILKGGSDARESNEAIVKVIKKVLNDFSINPYTCELLPSDRESTAEMLSARGYIDVIIPRGSRQLIDYVAANSMIPVIETGAGIVHTYLDQSADIQKAAQVICNAKTRRVSVCNALDCLLVHRTLLPQLPEILKPLAEKEVIIYADSDSRSVLEGSYPEKCLQDATSESFGTEFLSMKMALKTVDSLDEAIEHIHRYSSKHSEAILSAEKKSIEKFLNEVDSAVVYVNTSTAFTDGGQFGMGAEIGISTQKLHARGPMGLAELCSYKWIVRGNGQTRDN